jgi:hypothetical protein
VIVRIALLDGDVPSIDKTALLQSLTECFQEMRKWPGRRAAEEADRLVHRLLPERRNRLGDSRARQQSDEFTPSHSITSSARISRLGAIKNPRVLVSFGLTTNSTA